MALGGRPNWRGIEAAHLAGARRRSPGTARRPAHLAGELAALGIVAAPRTSPADRAHLAGARHRRRRLADAAHLAGRPVSSGAGNLTL